MQPRWAADGNAYTLQQFINYYGRDAGTRFWEQSPVERTTAATHDASDDALRVSGAASSSVGKPVATEEQTASSAPPPQQSNVPLPLPLVRIRAPLVARNSQISHESAGSNSVAKPIEETVPVDASFMPSSSSNTQESAGSNRVHNRHCRRQQFHPCLCPTIYNLFCMRQFYS